MYKPLLRRAVSGLARGLDRAFTETALTPRKRFSRMSHAERLDHAGRMRALRLIGSFYDRPEFSSLENDLFPRPRAVTPKVTRVRALGARGDVFDLTWASEFEPLWSSRALTEHLSGLPEANKQALGLLPGAEALAANGFDRAGELRDKYLRATENRTAHARWFRHSGPPRPCVVLIHGYIGGNYLLEERIWPVKRLFQSGIDVVLTVLPLHGPRRAEARGYLPPAFPSSDPRFTIEGFRQLVFDHRALFDHLQRCGVQDLGVMGMSLGGYSAALLATLERALRFAVFMVPLAARRLCLQERAHDRSRRRAARAARGAAAGAPNRQSVRASSSATSCARGECGRRVGSGHRRRAGAQAVAALWRPAVAVSRWPSAARRPRSGIRSSVAAGRGVCSRRVAGMMESRC